MQSLTFEKFSVLGKITRAYEEIRSFAFNRVGQQTLRKGCGHTEQKLKTNAQKIVYFLNNAVHPSDKVGERRQKSK